MLLQFFLLEVGVTMAWMSALLAGAVRPSFVVSLAVKVTFLEVFFTTSVGKLMSLYF